jgi:hypothetical protein
VIDLPHALFMIGQQIRDGLFTPSVITLGAEQQVVKLVINPALGPQIPGAARVAVDSIESIQMDGKFVIPSDTAGSASANTSAPAMTTAPTTSAGDSVAKQR